MLHPPLDRILRRALARVYVPLVIPLFLTVTVVGAGLCQAGTPGARYVHLRIDTDRSRYSLGDSISVRVALVNTSGTPVKHFYGAPWERARLIVTNEQGQVVDPTAPPTATDISSGRHVTLRAHDTDHTLTWNLQEWFDLGHWGYRLTQPGRYTITGIPLVFSERFTHDLRTVRSNQVTITVAP